VSGRAFVGLSPTNFRTLAFDREERRREVWPGEVDFLDWTTGVTRAQAMARLVRDAGRYDAIVVDGSVGLKAGYLDVMAAGAIGKRRRGPVVLIADATWKRGKSALDRTAMQAGIRLVDAPRVHYCVLSHEEVRQFPRTWGVDPGKVHFTPWPHTLAPHELEATREGGIFAGGDSMRDYGPLVEIAGDIDAEITIATRLPLSASSTTPNLRVGPLPHETFVEELRRASIVVVPMVQTQERGAGQTTYVNAMALGKLVVVTDTTGARDYIEDGVTGSIVPVGDADALRNVLRWATDPTNRGETGAIAERARGVALDRFSPDQYVINLLSVAREALGRG
jgi:glycosyltransferase involved in cell wall biosynthesis